MYSHPATHSGLPRNPEATGEVTHRGHPDSRRAECRGESHLSVGPQQLTPTSVSVPWTTTILETVFKRPVSSTCNGLPRHEVDLKNRSSRTPTCFAPPRSKGSEIRPTLPIQHQYPAERHLENLPVVGTWPGRRVHCTSLCSVLRPSAAN